MTYKIKRRTASHTPQTNPTLKRRYFLYSNFTCRVVGESCNCNKTLYLHNRRYLPPNHPLRHQKKGHVLNSTELRDAPDDAFDYSKTCRLRRRYDELPNNHQREKFVKETGIKGSYAFMELSYHEGKFGEIFLDLFIKVG